MLHNKFHDKQYGSLRKGNTPFPSSEDLPNPGIEPKSTALQVVSCIAGGFFTD